MGHFFLQQRYGRPQVLAGLLLLTFVAQCIWLIGRGTGQLEVQPAEFFRVQEGLAQWKGESVAGIPSLARGEIATSVPAELAMNEDYDANHSPLWYLVASAPLLPWEQYSQANSMHTWIWLERIPYILFGVLLGASLWYVSRRLYGNAGGYIALGLYCFSPAMIHSSALWMLPPEMSAAWSTFGAIFTAIAVAHTLYAPREVVLWNWRRILLLGLSLALAMGSQFSSIILLPLTLGFMLYLAPARKGAALAIWASACAFAFVLLFASYFFHAGIFWKGMQHADFLGFTWKSFGIPGVYRQVLFHLGHGSPALLLAFPLALISFFIVPRARYFGNIAPLLVALLFLALAFASPHYPGLGFWLLAVPFLFAFVAGVSADLLETRRRTLVQACLWGLLIANALWNLAELAQVGRG